MARGMEVCNGNRQLTKQEFKKWKLDIVFIVKFSAIFTLSCN